MTSSRRGFLKQLGVAAAASSLPASSFSGFAEGTTSSSMSSMRTALKNRAPLAQSAFYPLPLGAVRPTGWLQAQLKIQADGMGGHLDETWPDVGPNSGWLGGTGESWERGPYFLDGLVPLAYILDDARLKTKAQKYLDWTLNNQAANGMLGPGSNDDWWPRIVILKVLTQYHEATADPRVIPAMQRYFAYQAQELPKRKLRDWGRFRWQDEALSIVWLYNRAPDPKLLDLMRLLHEQGYDWTAESANSRLQEPMTSARLKELPNGGGLSDLALATHGVNNGQGVKMGPVWSLLSGSEADRKAVLRTIADLDKYHGLPNGMFSCDEHLAGLNPSHGSELCTVVEYMFSLEQSLAILGNPTLGDRLERLAFNALPGTFTDDMWAHQYDQQPNQIECSLHTKPWTTNGPESNLFGLDPNFGCCTANFHQGWPKFTASLFMLSHEDDLVACAYAPCEVRTSVRDTPVHVAEETEYPFRGSVVMKVNPATPVKFALGLRMPAWADDPSITVNGKPEGPAKPGSFARVERTWQRGDIVEIKFPLKPRVSRWFNDSVAIERGPLVFSYGIGESWVKLRDRGMTADWQVYPTSQWNYALAVSPEDAATSVSAKEFPISKTPFGAKRAPVELHVQARKLTTWRSEDGAANPVPSSPVSSDEPKETITLIPYAAAKLRITAFPQSKT
ncbi:MAG: putative glycosyl hydrolase [Acidobacteriaceae bacterium]|nr:putative glycosyl hydrolase [Acidobacteriaceae bacterium]